MEQTQKNNIDKIVIAGLATGLVAWSINTILNYEEEDTINYTLRDKGRIVYVGVCYADRLHKRLAEHRCSGKIFTNYTISRLKKGSEALQHERRRIRKYRPKYN